MTRRIGNGTVEVELGSGVVAMHWPAAGVTAGPFAARVEWSDGTRRSDSGSGAWHVERGEAGGRQGFWARWASAGAGARLAAHVAAEGPVVVVECGDGRHDAGVLHRVVVLEGAASIAAGPRPDDDVETAVATRLVEGFEGCSYAGVQDATSGGDSWWRVAYAASDGRTLALTALTARRFATVIESHPAAPDVDQGTDIGGVVVHVTVGQGATPEMVHARGTIGHVVQPQGPLGMHVPAGATVRSEQVAIAAGPDPFALVEHLAALAGRAMGARPRRPTPTAGWESWYCYGLLDVSAENVVANARTMRDRYGSRPGFDLVQIDDGWQRTYGGWWPNERFPADLAELTAALRALRCRPGLWLAPFMVQPGAPGLATDHPEWMIHDRAGAPKRDRHDRWGVDATHPDALAWMHDLGAQVRSWGFEMVKLDFLHLGAMEGARHDPSATGIDAMRRGLDAFLDGLGRDVYVLACMVPLLAVVGLCDAVRTGNDLATPLRHRAFGDTPPVPDWTGFRGIRPQLRNTSARWALHGRWFDLDPDVVIALGNDGADPGGYPVEESRALATMAALAGGPFLLADDLGALAPAERAVLEHPALLDLAGGGGFRPVDLFSRPDRAEVEHVFAQTAVTSQMWTAERADRRVVALWNWSDTPEHRDVPEGFVGAEELWTGEVAGAEIEVPAHGVRVLLA